MSGATVNWLIAVYYLTVIHPQFSILNSLPLLFQLFREISEVVHPKQLGYLEQQLSVNTVAFKDSVAGGTVNVQLIRKPDHAATLGPQLLENVFSYGWGL